MKDASFYIETEKVVLNEGEEINNALICIICHNILKDPQECSKCQRAYCNSCIKKLIRKLCPLCKNNFFINPSIETLHYLNTMIFKLDGCECKVPYKEYNYHQNFCVINKLTIHDKDRNLELEKLEEIKMNQIIIKDENMNSIITSAEICDLCKLRSEINDKCYLCKKIFCYTCIDMDTFKIQKISNFICDLKKLHIFTYLDNHMYSYSVFKKIFYITLYIILGLFIDFTFYLIIAIIYGVLFFIFVLFVFPVVYLI
jgi:hypothetical protein